MLGSNASGKAVRPSECDITWLDTAGHIVCFGCRVDDLVNRLHGEIERHEFALRARYVSLRSKMVAGVGKNSGHTTGCKPANAAPTVRPAKPDSVMGLSMTLFSPNRSSSPLVTLYLMICVSEVVPAELQTETYAPLYWATSSPSTNTLSFDASSSARASFKASLTATSFTPLGVAYLLLFKVVGNEVVGSKTDRGGAVQGRECARRREVGRRRREGTMAEELLVVEFSFQSNGEV